MEKHTKRTAWFPFFLSVGLVLLQAYFPLNAQERDVTPSAARGAPAGSYAISPAESVNLYNGNLNFSLPLVSVNSRGESDTALEMRVDHLWKTSTWYGYEPIGTNPDDVWVGHAVPYLEVKPSYSSGPGSLFFESHSVANGVSGLVLTITFLSADGTELRLADDSTKGDPGWDNCEMVAGYIQCNLGQSFSSMDGSNINFLSDRDIIKGFESGGDGPVPYVNDLPDGVLMFPDGRKMRVDDALITSIVDRNGNKTGFTYSTVGTLRNLTKITDALGRETVIQYDVNDSSPYGKCDRIISKGYGGADRIIRISKRKLVTDSLLKSGLSSKTLRQLFPLENSPLFYDPPGNSSGAPPDAGVLDVNDDVVDPELPATVWLPDGRSYGFRYDNYGGLARVELPTGGAIEYDWSAAVGNYLDNVGLDDVSVFNNYWYNEGMTVTRRVVERRTYDSSNALQGKTTYSTGWSCETFNSTTYLCTGSSTTSRGYSVDEYTQVDQKSATNTLMSRERHFFYGMANSYGSGIAFLGNSLLGIGGDWREGREYKTESLNVSTNNVLRKVEQTWAQSSPPAWFSGNPTIYCQSSSCPVPLSFPRVTERKVTLGDSSQVEKTVYSHDQFLNVTDVYTYDLGSGTPGSLLRRVHTGYVTSSNYLDQHLLSLPSEKWISTDQSGTNKVSLTEFEYDNYATTSPHHGLEPRSSVSGHDSSGYDTSFIYRGNATATTSYADAGAQTGAVTTYSQYDILGNVIKTFDANLNVTTIDYSDNFGFPDSNATTNSAPSQLSGLSTFALPTSTTNPKNWTSYVQYDYFTGAPVNAKDINDLISKTSYDDPLDRPKQTVAAIGTANEIQTSFEYDDANRRIETTSDLFELDDNLQKSELIYDSFGRTIEKRRYSEGDYVSIKTEFDSLGRVKKVSNPFRPARSETALWNQTTYDSLGRVVETETPDGAIVLTAYDGNRTLVTDQAGKKRISRVDALGQLKDVWEITTPDSITESVSFPSQSFSAGYRTSYSYDALSNLIEVNQGSQTREFTYNDLSLLVSASNPESGTISYTFDANGNLKTKRDARNIKTVFDYDELNRVTKRCYRAIGTGALGMTTCASNTETQEPNTSDVAYTYENSSVTALKSVITKVANGNSTTEYIGFDASGRITRTKQTTDGVVYGDDTNPMTYAYSLSGALVEQSYPSGRVVKNVLDHDARLSVLESKKNVSSGYWNYASSFTYNPAGAVMSMQLGNGRWESTIFNSRLQPTQIGLGTVANGTDKLKLEYSYGDWNGSSIDASKNNGNIVKQIIAAPNSPGNSDAFIATQKYYYDSLNRIDDATEESSETWRQDFSYDRYGNRNFVEENTSTIPRTCGSAPTFTICTADHRKYNPSINTSNNNRIDTSEGYSFDSSGNTTGDSGSNTFVYDGENKQVEAKNSGNYTVGRYYYDGDGKRIKKIAYNATGTEIETTVFVYDATGKQIAEYSDVVANSTDAKVAYLTSDNLGSPRINTDASGYVISRHDYHPFGEEITTGRTQAEYAGDTVRKRYTGYERDGETELDFAEARMYSFQNGRLTSPDDFRNDADGNDPQSWNLYIYVRNKPLLLVDPTGEMGDYYEVGTGRYVGSDGIPDGLVYAAVVSRETHTSSGGSFWFSSTALLPITHTEFQARAATAYGESSAFRLPVSNDLANEMMAIAYVNNRNSVAYGANNSQAQAFMNTTLEGRTGKMQLANFAVLNQLTGGPDPSNGATMWDGAEQALFSAKEKRTSVPAIKPAKGTWELHKNSMGWDISNQDYATWKANVGKAFKAPQTTKAVKGSKNAGKTRLHSTAVYGRTIFWRVTP